MKKILSFFKKLFGPKPKCEKCGSTKLEHGYWIRGWNKLCEQAYGDYGTRCYDCGMIEWNETEEEHLKTLPKFCTPFKSKLTMKNIILLCFITLLFSSCTADYIVKADSMEGDILNIEYFKDRRTGLCFGTTGESITCVPCDSLKNIKFQ